MIDRKGINARLARLFTPKPERPESDFFTDDAWFKRLIQYLQASKTAKCCVAELVLADDKRGMIEAGNSDWKKELIARFESELNLETPLRSQIIEATDRCQNQ